MYVTGLTVITNTEAAKTYGTRAIVSSMVCIAGGPKNICSVSIPIEL
jgi:hypothetical protein